MQEVICECYNCTTRQSDGWRGFLSDFIAGGSVNPCLKSPEWFPKPAVCPQGPGGGGTYTPPVPPSQPPTATAPPTPEGTYPTTTPAPDQGTSATRAFCGPAGGPFTIVEVDPVTADPIRIIARDVPFGDPAYEWTGLVNNPPWCADFTAQQAAPTPTPGAPTPIQCPPGQTFVNGACLDTSLVSPVDGTPPPTGIDALTPIPATEAPVLPARQPMAVESPPTGAWPGQPFQVAPQRPVPVAKAPAPMPEACPLGPVPLRRWFEGCMGVPQA